MPNVPVIGRSICSASAERFLTSCSWSPAISKGCQIACSTNEIAWIDKVAGGLQTVHWEWSFYPATKWSVLGLNIHISDNRVIILCDCCNFQDPWLVVGELLLVHWLNGFMHFRTAFLYVRLSIVLQVCIQRCLNSTKTFVPAPKHMITMTYNSLVMVQGPLLESLLKLVSCKGGCGNACGCQKLMLHCTPMCNQCEGQTCSSTADLHNIDDWQSWNVL